MLNGQTVELYEMLNARENRAEIQKLLREKYHCTILSFCLNIPGPVKTSSEIRKVFDYGLTKIFEELSALKFKVLEKIEIHEKTGDECIMAVTESAQLLKLKMTALEESTPLNRLFDIDVVDSTGQKLSRKVPRRCLICEEQAQICARSRKHSVEELIRQVEYLISSAIYNEF